MFLKNKNSLAFRMRLATFCSLGDNSIGGFQVGGRIVWFLGSLPLGCLLASASVRLGN